MASLTTHPPTVDTPSLTPRQLEYAVDALELAMAKTATG
jgi:hypothetical protein